MIQQLLDVEKFHGGWIIEFYEGFCDFEEDKR